MLRKLLGKVTKVNQSYKVGLPRIFIENFDFAWIWLDFGLDFSWIWLGFGLISAWILHFRLLLKGF